MASGKFRSVIDKGRDTIYKIKNNPSFTVKEQLGYASGMFGNCMGQDCVYTYSSKFNRDFQMIDTLKLDFVETVSEIIAFFISPIAGALLDLPVREGHKSFTKRVLQIAPFPFAVTSLLLFVVPTSDAAKNLVWSFVMYLLFASVDTFYDMSMGTIALRMTTNPNDRKNFFTVSSLASSLGSMLPGWVLPIIVERFKTAAEQKWAYFFVALVFCVLGVSAMLAPYFTLNEKVGLVKAHENEKIIWNRHTLMAILRNRPFVVAQLATVFETVRQVTYDLLPDIYRETFDEYGMKTKIDMISGSLAYAGLASVPLVGTKVSARTMMVGGHLYSALFYAAAAAVGINFNLERVRKLRYLVGVLIGLSGMPNYGMSAAKRIIVADSTDYMEWFTEKKYGAPVRSDGMLTAVGSVVGKLNALLRINIKNLSLTAIGYQSGKVDANGQPITIVQSDRTLKGIFFVVTLCGVIGNLVPGLIYLLDNFTGKRRDDIRAELDEMRKLRASEDAPTVEISSV
ncbi:MAG: MFS transporter [Clostridia bacterium]|nr:MFS transporter [Clostridia bacterium]